MFAPPLSVFKLPFFFFFFCLSHNFEVCPPFKISPTAPLVTWRHSLQLIQNEEKFKNTLKNIQECDCLVVDEISMISKNIFEKVEFICRNVRKHDFVFGGIQVVGLGDWKCVKIEWWHHYLYRLLTNHAQLQGKISLFMIQILQISCRQKGTSFL